MLGAGCRLLPWLLLFLTTTVFLALVFGQNQTSGARESLSYISNDAARRGIYLIDLRSRLTHRLPFSAEGIYRSPTWSPDGRWLAFVMEVRGGRRLLFVAGTEASKVYALTQHESEDFSPTWSPDGRWLAFVSNRDGQQDIYRLDARCLAESTDCAARAENLTLTTTNEAEPAWSPDSRLLAFVSDREQQRDIYILDAAGGSVRNLTNHRAEDFSPAWSPDGARIAFVSDRPRNYEIYVMTIGENEGRARNLTRNRAEEWFPVWSPDGGRLAFISDRAGSYEIYLLTLETGKLSNLTRNETNDFAPVWSPDGGRIAFVSNRGPTQQIYMMELGCVTIPEKCSRQVTFSSAENAMPLWRP